MKFSPGLYEFIWYEVTEIKNGKNKKHLKHTKFITYTLAFNRKNALENTLNLARSVEKYDDLIFSYAKVWIMYTFLRMIFLTATQAIYGEWSDELRYVPAKDKYL